MRKAQIWVCVLAPLLILAVAAGSGYCDPAGIGDRVRVDELFTSETINGTATVTSDAVNVESDGYFSIEVEISGTSPHVKIEYLVASRGDRTFYVPNGAPDIVSDLTASGIYGFSPTVSKLMEIRVTGLGTNGTDTEITLRLNHQ